MTETAGLPLIARPTTRTHDEICERIRYIAHSEFFGFQTGDLLAYLPYDKAKEFLRADANEGEWRAEYPIFVPPLKAAVEYLPFAWEKANNRRGLSAQRSLDHFQAWLWLAGWDKQMDELFDDYDYYGKGLLVLISELLGFNWREVDDGKWVNNETDPPLEDTALAIEITKWVNIAQIHMKE